MGKILKKVNARKIPPNYYFQTIWAEEIPIFLMVDTILPNVGI